MNADISPQLQHCRPVLIQRLRGAKRWRLLIALAAALTVRSEAPAQFTFAADSATNAAYGDGWASGDNGGSGFNAWSLSIPGANAGVFIGNPANNGMGTSGIGTTAFGLFSSANNSGYVNATRSLGTAMGIGDTLSFYWSMNWDSSGGAKGFDIKSGGSTIFNVNNAGSQNISVGGVTAFTGYGTAPMLVTLLRTTDGFTFTMTDRAGGASYTTNVVTSSNVTGFNLYEGNQGDGNGNRNIYFNNFLSTNSGVFSTGGTVTNANTFSGSGSLAVGNNTTLVLNGGGNNDYSGTTTVSNGSRLSLAGSGNSTFGSTVSGEGSLTKAGSGTLVLTSSGSTFTGGTTLDAGTLRVGHANAIGTGTLNINGGVLASDSSTARIITNSVTMGGNVTIGDATGTGMLTLSNVNLNQATRTFTVTTNAVIAGVISNGGAAAAGLTKAGNGTLSLTGNNTYTGKTTVTGGTLNVINGASMGGAPASAVADQITISGGAALNFNGSGAGFALASNRGITLGAGGGTIGVASNSATVSYNGIIAGEGGLTKIGLGTLSLSNANTYAGATTINQGTLRLGGGGIVSSNANVNVAATLGASTFDLSGITTSTTIGSLSGGADSTVNLGSKTLVAGGDNTSTTFSGVIAGVGGSFTKAGTGTMTFAGSASNTYSGKTTVSGGVLSIDSDSRLGAAPGSAVADQLTLSGGNSASGSKLQTTADVTLAQNRGITLSGGGGVLAVSSGTLTYDGVITGSGGLGKEGAGTLSLGGASTYSGTTLFRGGTMLVGNNQALGTGTFMFSFADDTAKTLASLGGTARTITNAIQIYNNLTLGQSSGNTGSLTFSGPVDLGNETNQVRVLTTASGTTHTISGVVAGARGIVKSGAGTLVLSGANTFSGHSYLVDGTTLFDANPGAGFGAGTLYLGETNGSAGAVMALGGSGVSLGNAIEVRSGSSGAVMVDARNTSGTASLSGNITLGRNAGLNATAGGALSLAGTSMNFAGSTTLSVTNTGAVTIANQLITSGDALLEKHGNGTVTLSNGSNYGDMRYDLYAGTLQISQEGNLGNASTFKANKLYLHGGTLKATETFALQSNNGITVGAEGGVFEVAASKSLELQQYINDMANVGVSLYKSGAGTLFLNRGTSYDLSGSTWKVTEGTLSTWNPGGNLTATVELGGAASTGTYNFTKTDGGVSVGNNVLINAGGGNISVTDNTLTMTGVLSGSGSFGKTGAGSLVLSGNHTHAGAATVQGGTLVVDGTLASASVTVQNGATVAGSGSLGLTTIQQGGTISPGNSPGTLTLTNGLAWSGGGNYNWQIFDAAGSAGSGWDLIDVTGGSWDINGLSSTNRFNINLWSLSAINPDAGGVAINFDGTQSYSWKILAATAVSGTFSTNLFTINTGSVNGTAGFAGSSGLFSLSMDGNNDLFLNYAPGAQPVPEPGTWAAGLLLLAGAAALKLRRQTRG